MKGESVAMLSATTAQASSAGAKESNEDSMGIHAPVDEQLLTHKGIAAVIADGVSAADGGREAAETCVQNFLNDYFSTPETWTVQTASQKVLTALNRWLYGQSAKFSDAHKGYVCTLSILIVKSRTAYVFHVGDTRVHLLRHGTLKQLTKDHAIEIAPGATYLARAMGLDSRVDVDFLTRPVEAGDVFLLTSDGVHDYVGPEAMTELIGQAESLEVACEQLLLAASKAGSPDNLTCQLVRIDSTPDVSADEYLRHLSELPFAPELSSGMILDGFRVERELCSSRRSQLYLVTQQDTGRRLVMKTPSVNYEDDPAYIERFILEQWIGTRVRSKHLVRSIAPPDSRTCLYNLMEYVPGDTLEQWISKRGSKLDRDFQAVVGLLGQVVRGLIALHRKEIIHQDLKPGNIICGEDGVVKIIDYGSCFVAGVDEIATPIMRDKILGTVSYAAPEYSVGYKVGTHSDLYSLGCIAYEMLTGKHPYGSAAEDARTLADFEALHYTPAYVHNPHVPVWMDRAIEKAVKLNPAERYAELSEFMYDLEHPNQEYLAERWVPLLDRESLPAWRAAALILLCTQVVTLVLLLRLWFK